MSTSAGDHDAVVMMKIDSAWLAADNPQFVYLQHYSAELFLASPMNQMARPVGDVRFVMLDVAGWLRDKRGSVAELFSLSEQAQRLYKIVYSVNRPLAKQYQKCIESGAQNVLIIERLDILPGYRHLNIGEMVINEVVSKMHRDGQIILADPTNQGIKLTDAYDALFLPLAPVKANDSSMAKNYRKSLRFCGFQRLVGSGIFARASVDLSAKIDAEA